MKRLDFSLVRLAVLHHSVHEPDPASTAFFEMQRIRQWHLDAGKSDVGYHFVAFRNNYVAARPLPYQGAHCRGWNSRSIGFCLCADLTKRAPTFAEVRIMANAIVQAEVQVGHQLVVVGHRELGNTDCPGPDLVRLVNSELMNHDR